jgi:hypothetical protein
MRRLRITGGDPNGVPASEQLIDHRAQASRGASSKDHHRLYGEGVFVVPDGIKYP